MHKLKGANSKSNKMQAREGDQLTSTLEIIENLPTWDTSSTQT
jgi:hypothetical protein